MLRVHLAQIFFQPAYYDPPIDYTEEPCFLTETDRPLGTLRSVLKNRGFFLDSKSDYIEHLRVKLTDVARWSGQRKANFLVFPEYSVPPQLLPDLQRAAKEYSMTVVAGTHRIPVGGEAQSIYDEIGMISPPIGAACAPILLHDGTVQVAMKLKRSKWEPNLNTPSADPKIISIDCGGTACRLSVVPCVDSLHLDVIGKLWSDEGKRPHLIVCPSLSPTVDPFQNIGSLAALNEALFAYANTASFGGTFFNLPTSWQSYLKGSTHSLNPVASGVEAVLELDVDLEKFFAKRGSIEIAPVCTRPLCFPIVYKAGADWLPTFVQLREDLLEWMAASDKQSAIDWLDSFLAEIGVSLPVLLMHNLKFLRHSTIPLYDGDPDSIVSATELVQISDTVEDTQVLWARRVAGAFDVLTQELKEAESNSIDTLLECLKSLKNHQRTLPNITAVAVPQQERPTPALREVATFSGEMDLVEAFQNRGGDLDFIRNFLANNENRVIVVTGPLGIGKTEFLTWMFKKMLTDWQPIRIQIPTAATIPRVVAAMGYQLGLPLDIDSLASCTHDVFRSKIRKLFSLFYSLPKRALIVDDLHQVLKNGAPRDHRQMRIILEEAAAPHSFVGGRLFLASSLWLPETWLKTKGVAHLHLQGLKDLYTGRVIEYHVRKANLVSGETIPAPPQALLDVVKGHPLSARLVVEALRDNKDLSQLANELVLSKITGYIARELLKRVPLTPEEESTILRLSVFRLPVAVDVLRHCEVGLDADELITLANRLILSYDGELVAMHEVIRRFYYARIPREDATAFHRQAALYYQKLYQDQPYAVKKDPGIVAELAHHLALCGDIPKARDLRILILEEIKPAAREVYRVYRNYSRALSLYRLLADIAPDDPGVLAYVGRCYARLGQWEDSDSAFQQAINAAIETGREVWWIYRDWGHIRARFNYYERAQELLETAASYHPNDPSIVACVAYMYWQQGFWQEACDHFEEALKLNPYHEYTLTFYPRLLDQIGQSSYAEILHGRLTELASDLRYESPAEYDVEVDYDD